MTVGSTHYRDLGSYSDWVDFGRRQVPARYDAAAGAAQLTPAIVRDLLGFAGDGPPTDVRIDRAWERDGVAGQAVSWSVGYGPRTQAWVLRPSGVDRPLPGVLALHDHSNFKSLGKEKIADGPDGPDPRVHDLRQAEYDGLAFANRLARRGFCVLVPDVFLWGSRRFDRDVVVTQPSGPRRSWITPEPDPGGGRDHGDDTAAYNRAAVRHEHVVAKYCTLLGTSLAGVVAYEDRIAASYLAARPDVAAGGVGCIGLSGGGARAALLQAASEAIRVAVVVAMMSTYPQLFDRHVAPHTWLFFPPGLAPHRDWPELAACRAPSPLVVQYVLGDELFPDAGQLAAHEQISARYAGCGRPQAYVGEVYEGRHWFSQAMQDAAFDQLAHWMS